jgi:A/G-specific adenine glycosylase
MPQTATISARQLPFARRRLLAWFRSAQRDMPWRRTRDPYRIWLSEIMLQQTRVAAVVPYYWKFVARFPTVRALARAPADAVLRHWAGLGYYSRARNLHRAAKQIVARHSGKFPDTQEAALALPGIGHYTAAAVLSIGYGRPLAVLDGNVARVLARLFVLRGDLRQPQRWRRLQARADELLAQQTPGDWNQAMMELGAAICTPRAPRCPQCPMTRWCRARALGIVADLPTARRKPTPVKITLAAAVLLDPRGRTFLVRPSDSPDDSDASTEQNSGENNSALFSRLWQFPAIAASCSGRAGGNARHGARRSSQNSLAQRDFAKRPSAKHSSANHVLAEYLERTFGLRGVKLESLPIARHSVTFRQIHLAPFLARVDRLPAVPGAQTPPLDQVARLPVSSATRKIGAAALASL